MSTNKNHRWGAVRPLALVALAAGLLGLKPAGEPTDCQQRLLLAYRKLAGQKSASRDVCHLQFVSTTAYPVPGKRTNRETTVHAEVYTQGNRGYFHTDDMSLWQDGRYVATTLRSRRTVLLTRVAPGAAVTAPLQMLQVRDSLIQVGQLLQCRSEQQGQRVVQHLQLGYKGVLATRTRLKTLDFWLTPQNTLQQMRLSYQPGGPIQQVTMNFPLQEWLSTSDKLPVDARRQVVDEQGHLLPAYQGYQLVNQVMPGQ